ncbi:hypothetical protein GGS20DRAFT_557007 [Poronia punctata]|nr:hypothetical protein GGS20DRAFT_557007 [Poronia punctata]
MLLKIQPCFSEPDCSEQRRALRLVKGKICPAASELLDQETVFAVCLAGAYSTPGIGAIPPPYSRPHCPTTSKSGSQRYHCLPSPGIWRRVILETSNPEQVPLPSWELLHLQYDMQRIARACAAGDILAATPQRQVPTGGSVAYNVDEEYGLPGFALDTPGLGAFLLDEAVEQGLLPLHERADVEQYFLVEE